MYIKVHEGFKALYLTLPNVFIIVMPFKYKPMCYTHYVVMNHIIPTPAYFHVTNRYYVSYGVK